MRRRRGLGALAGGFALALVALLLLPSLAGAASVETRPAVFTVQNLNRSQVQCSTDGRTYRVRGLLVGPAGSLRTNGGPVTLYLHGLGFGRFFWDFQAVPGYNFAAAMAQRGHVSAIVDRLGYGASDHPDGTQSCIGGQADVAHQVVQGLRTGTYSAGPGPAVKFGKVALVGHSAGGAIAQVETYSFRDVAALGVLSWADQGQSQLAGTTFAAATQTCLNGGQPSGGAPGYAPFGATDADFQAAMFHDADPAVVSAATSMRNPDPCGDDESLGQTSAVDHAMLPTIAKPVLLGFGENDALFPPPAGSEQRAQFAGSGDVSLIQLPDTGHAVTLERSAPALVADLAGWLSARGF
ncbi:MAG: alpha/beta fold hydrolase [Gaiellaceae bacterium]